MVTKLLEIISDNWQFYLKVNVGFSELFQIFNETLKKLDPIKSEIEGFAGDYDLDDASPGNGYRSFIYIFDSAVKSATKICDYVKDNRGGVFFRRKLYEK